MKNILLFENFSNYETYLKDKRIKWPDAIFWIDKLYPEEIAYLALYSKERKSDDSMFIPFYCGRKNDSIELESDGDEESEASFEMLYEIPTEKGDITFSFYVDAKGGFTSYSPGTYWDPPEGGESILNDIEISDVYFLDAEEENEIFLNDPNKYQYKSEFVKREDIMELMIENAEEKISFSDSNVETVGAKLYQGLIDKCEKIRSENNFGSRITGIVRRFT